MSIARVVAALTYAAAVAIAANEAGWAVAFLVVIMGAACLALAYAATGSRGDLLDRSPRRPERRRRRA